MLARGGGAVLRSADLTGGSGGGGGGGGATCRGGSVPFVVAAVIALTHDVVLPIHLFVFDQGVGGKGAKETKRG